MMRMFTNSVAFLYSPHSAGSTIHSFISSPIPDRFGRKRETVSKKKDPTYDLQPVQNHQDIRLF